MAAGPSLNHMMESKAGVKLSCKNEQLVQSAS